MDAKLAKTPNPMTLTMMARVVVVMLLWAVCFPLITIGIEYSPHLTFAALRAVLAGTVLVALALALGRPLPEGWRVWTILVFIGLGATSLGYFGMFHAAEFVSPGIATVIANTQPLLAAFLAGLFLGENLDARMKTGLAVGFGGIFMITLPRLLSASSDGYAFGIAYIVLAALGITVSNVLIKRIAGRVDAMMAMGMQMLIGSLPLFGGAWAIERPLEVIWSPRFILALVALSVFGSALVYWLWFSVLEKVALSQANAFSFLIPIFGITVGVLFYGEAVGWLGVVGIGMSILGIALVVGKASSR